MTNQLEIDSIKPSDLPAPPEAAIQIMRACSKAEVTNQELTDIASRDPVLTAELLRVVNAPFFGLSSEVQSIARAITVLGHKALRNIVLCISVRDALRTDDLEGFDAAGYWEDSLRRAVAAKLLGKQLKLDEDECFTAGLLQDFGLLVLLFLQQDKASEWKSLRAKDPGTRHLLEKEIFTATHEQVSAMLADAWSLPESLGKALGQHHDCAAVSGKSYEELCKILHCADWMCAVFSIEEKSLVLDQCRKLLAGLFCIDSDRADELLAEMPEMVEAAAQAIGLHVEQQPDFDQVLRETNVRLAESNLDYQDLTWRLEKAIRERDELAEELSRELEVAAEIQNSLLPNAGGENFPVSGINISARELSGDFFDFFELEDGRIYFSLGDVSGKGITAALLMAKTCSLFRCLGKQNDSPGKLLAIINNEICETSVRGMFVTLIAGIYNPACGTVVVVNAGSPPALLFQQQGDVHRFMSDGPPLGIVPGFEYPECTLNMRGGSLYLYSDGVTEGHIKENEMLGEESLLKILQKLQTRQPADRLQAIAQCFKASPVPQRDDITMLVVEDSYAGFQPVMNYRFRAAAEELKNMRAEIIKGLQKTGCSADFGKRMVIAVNEACMNIIQHAYGGDSDGEIDVEILNNGQQLIFRITDFAKPIDTNCVKSRDLDDVRPGGLGVHFMNEVMDETCFLDQCGKAGNILEMRKNLE